MSSAQQKLTEMLKQLILETELNKINSTEQFIKKMMREISAKEIVNIND